MRKTRTPRLLAAVLVSLASGCASSTVIRSDPTGAAVFLNGEKVGLTPYTMTDTKPVGSVTTVLLVKPGCENFTTVLSRSEELDPAPVIFGFCALGVPFFWAMKYRPEHLYELECSGRPAASDVQAALEGKLGSLP
jgi:hypothetical protein